MASQLNALYTIKLQLKDELSIISVDMNEKVAELERVEQSILMEENRLNSALIKKTSSSQIHFKVSEHEKDSATL